VDRLELIAKSDRGDREVAVVGALLQPLHEGAGCRLADRGPGEEEVGLRILQGQAALEHRADRDRRDLVDPLAEREPEQVDLVEAERSDEGDCVLRHRGYGREALALRRADPPVVEGDHRVVGGDAVDDPRVPVVEDRAEEDDRHPGLCAEAPVGESRSADVDGLGGRAGVRAARDHALAFTRSM
jgi:hypothetical protein